MAPLPPLTYREDRLVHLPSQQPSLRVDRRPAEVDALVLLVEHPLEGARVEVGGGPAELLRAPLEALDHQPPQPVGADERHTALQHGDSPPFHDRFKNVSITFYERFVYVSWSGIKLE